MRRDEGIETKGGCMVFITKSNKIDEQVDHFALHRLEENFGAQRSVRVIES